MAIAKVKLARICGRTVTAMFNFENADISHSKFRIYLGDILLSELVIVIKDKNFEYYEEITLPDNFEGKQLKIFLKTEEEILVYSRLLPKTQNRRKSEWLEWISKVDQNSKKYKNSFSNEFSKFFDEL